VVQTCQCGVLFLSRLPTSRSRFMTLGGRLLRTRTRAEAGRRYCCPVCSSSDKENVRRLSSPESTLHVSFRRSIAFAKPMLKPIRCTWHMFRRKEWTRGLYESWVAKRVDGEFRFSFESRETWV